MAAKKKKPTRSKAAPPAAAKATPPVASKPGSSTYRSKTEADGTTGRPTICTPELEKAIVTKLGSGAYLPQCCEVSGVSYKTVKEWMQRGRKGEQPFADFRAAIRRAMRDREIQFVQLVTDAAAKDAKAAQWMLTHRYSARWADREKVEAEIQTQGEVRHIYVPKKRRPT